MQDNKWANLALIILGPIVIAVLILYVAGYFYLWYIHQPLSAASPMTVIRYWTYWGHLPRVKPVLVVCLVVAAAAVLAPVIALLVPRKPKLHGDAKWASFEEIVEAGLTGETGIILGKYVSWLGLRVRYLMLAGQLSVLLAAPPRSGKGAGVVNTNMLNWPGSAIVLDIRKESWRVTSGFRKEHGQECFLFNPVAEDGETCQWNPLTYVSDDPVLRINDLQKIANMLSPDPETSDPFWPASCRKLFLGLALYIFETEGLPRTFGEIVRQIMSVDGENVGEHWKKIIEERDKTTKPLSHLCKSALYDFIHTSTNTQSSIRATFTAKLELWMNPLVDAATAGDSFDLRNLRKQPISLYIGVEPGDIKRVSIILNLLFQQIIDLNTREMPEDNPDLKHQLLLMMDEFTALGRVPVLEASVSYLGGYNIRLAIIIQSPAQLRSVCGADVAETIVDCMGAHIVFAPKDNKTAKDISETLGYETIDVHSHSKAAGLSTARGTVNTSEHGRALLLPQEVRTMGRNREIIFIENVNPILCNKIRYFEDSIFKARLRPPVRVTPITISLPSPSATVKHSESPLQMSGDWKEMKEITAADLDKLDTLDLKDFSGDFSNVVLPAKEPYSEDEMQAAVDMFLANMNG